MAIKPFQLVNSIGAWQDAFTWHFVEASSQSYKAGTPLKLVSGAATIFSADNSVWAGIAMAAATGTTGADCPVILPLTNAIIQMSVDAYSSGTAAAGTGKPADLTVGATYAISADTASGLWYARASGGNASVLYLGCDPSQSAVIQGVGYFRVLQTTTQYT